jgi:NAD(P)H-dependent flavin oxidoreductase YrpB (nitropropane dioxygenase family)
MTPASPLPRIIQGGLGVAVSDWRLANAVAPGVDIKARALAEHVVRYLRQ